MTAKVQIATFAAPGAGTPVELFGPFNLQVTGTFTGLIRVERSFDNGDTWAPLSDAYGDLIEISSPVSTGGEEIEQNVLYRARAVTLSSGTCNVRLSK